MPTLGPVLLVDRLLIDDGFSKSLILGMMLDQVIRPLINPPSTREKFAYCFRVLEPSKVVLRDPQVKKFPVRPDESITVQTVCSIRQSPGVVREVVA